jgi:hypothetical protein
MAEAKADIVSLSDYAGLSALPPQQLDRVFLETQQRYIEAAQQAAPLSYQLQLARELIAIRMIRLTGQAGVIESAALTESVMAEMARTGLFTQVIIDGLRGKVPDAVVAKMEEIQGAFLEGGSIIHAVATGGIIDRVQQFKAPSSAVRFRDVAYGVLADKIPGKLTDGKR